MNAHDPNKPNSLRLANMLLATTLVIGACSAQGDEVSQQPESNAATTVEQSTTTTTVVLSTSTSLSEIPECQSAGTTTPGANSWPLPGSDLAYSSNNPTENLIGTQNVSLLEPAWSHDDIGGVSTTPLVVEEIVYYADWQGDVHAADRCTGALIWTSKVGERAVAASLAYADDIIVASGIEGNVHALRASDGEILWVSRLDDSPDVAGFGAPTIVDGIVIAGVAKAQNWVGWRGSIVAFDLEDGSEIWRLHTDNGDPTEGGGVAVWSSAAIDESRGLGFIGTGNSNDIRRDGEPVPDSPLSNAMLAFDYRTGELIWDYRILEEDGGRDLDIGAPPTLFSIDGRDAVAVGGKSGDFVALDRDSGEEMWRVTLTNGGRAGGVMKGAAHADGALFVASNEGFLDDGAMFALDPTDGSTVWRTDVGGAFIGHTVTTANGVVYTATMTGVAYGFDAITGEILWSFDLGASAQSGISVVDGIAYIGFGGGGPPDLRPTPVGGVKAFSLLDS